MTDLKQFVHKSHHELEAHSIKEALNPKRALLRAIRYYNLNSHDPTFGQHAKNLAVLLPFSETLELSTGPLVTQLTLATDWSLPVEALLNTIGWSVSVPFVVEPFCALTILAYGSSSRIQKLTTQVREKVTSVASNTCDRLGLTRALNYYFPKTTMVEDFLRNEWDLIVSGDEQVFIYAIKELSEESFIELELAHAGRFYVRTMSVVGVDKKRLKRELSFLGWSSVALLTENYKGASTYRRFQEREVVLRPKRRFCEDLLRRG